MENNMKIYHVKTREDYDTLMIELESKGAKWYSGEKPTGRDSWSAYTEDTCVRLNKDFVSYAGIDYYEEVYPNIPIQTYKASSQSLSSDDTVNSPEHYNALKNNIKNDLKKAQYYLQRAINKLED